MSSYYCEGCEISYPPATDYKDCLACGASTKYHSDAPDSDWRVQVEWKSGRTPVVDRDHIVIHNDQAWIADARLKEAGYPLAEVGTVIRVSGYSTEMFFEVDGPAKSNEKTKMRQVAGWWLHRVETVWTADDAEIHDGSITDPADAR